ncbi:MAG: hypothetical protein AAGD11_06785 [Planctomycetota bacterium]
MIERSLHTRPFWLAFIGVSCLAIDLTVATADETTFERSTVKAWIKGGKPETKKLRTLSHDVAIPTNHAHSLNRYGGTEAYPPSEATRFFRTASIAGRWWLIDPDGHRFLHVAVNSVKPYSGPTFREAFPKKFASNQDWAAQTVGLLHDHGFNGTGAWTDNGLLGSAGPRLVYTRMLNVMSSFGRKLKLTSQGTGHTSYKDRLIPVFHPKFPAHCRQVVQQLDATKDDPYLLGIFSDNELEHNELALDLHLDFPPDSPERHAAQQWLAQHYPDIRVPRDLTDQIREAYVGHMFETYFAIVGRAIRSVDANHLYLGSRLHGATKKNRWLLAGAGKHLDVVAVNVYGVWTPTKSVRKWSRWSGRPLLVTEFYAKGQDSGLANLSGAGWTVPTQSDRGRFYQHFTLGLLESRVCVGWHYFKYADNDPLDMTTDPSNRDSNKGILNSSYEPWTEFLNRMRALNARVYSIAEHFDAD